ncbi:hypothetical protein BCR33DRAFT_296585 [Rhizoclosmatium globosum]|uniref:ATPase AAA-type core domain-containing protein n=1 Tax=Rhizoclosmatium globosum TaxID=329046 RepID=A0A1Y2C6K7_9FUNG|nr:hypothetical protein BCR33DRAFT_296585 [Rhizoclosmatium globosum]|eukprot:ORY42507.1 hypothetical protein BCR33DRAFT_296585 [Rhizoclosmatium globosum]
MLACFKNVSDEGIPDKSFETNPFPQEFKDQFPLNEMGRHYLLYGSPGYGKTQFVECFAGSARLPLIKIGPSDAFGKYEGEGINKLVAKLKKCGDTNNSANHIKVYLNDFLSNNKHAVVFATTNHKNHIEASICSRFTKKVLFEPVYSKRTLQQLLYNFYTRELRQKSLCIANLREQCNELGIYYDGLQNTKFSPRDLLHHVQQTISEVIRQNHTNLLAAFEIIVKNEIWFILNNLKKHELPTTAISSNKKLRNAA